jgi:hypothetical protein
MDTALSGVLTSCEMYLGGDWKKLPGMFSLTHETIDIAKAVFITTSLTGQRSSSLWQLHC